MTRSMMLCATQASPDANNTNGELMTRYLTRLVAYLVCAALGACSAFELPSKKIEYKSAGKLPPLDVPPDLTRPTGDDRFVVPDTARGAATFSEYQRDR